MKRALFLRLDAAFNQALELDEDARATLLEDLAVSDPEMATRLKGMLRSAESGRDPLKSTIEDATAAYAPALPERVGPFKVIRLLGIGGMGAVYLCERSNGDFNQLLAVKRLAGMTSTSPFGRSRLVQERRVLARLRHPNIAQLVDGGDDRDGTPYVAMEYIEGSRIDRYAQAGELDRRDRVKLFLALCAAVQFAHQNLVVHRDIKSDNVLVDRHGQVKLLDFGIAKLLGDADPEAQASLPTVAGAMTPHYASPEQVRGEPASQTSDIYSLGMVLYELLTGRRAYRLDTTRPSEIEQIVCTSEPMAPSRVAGWRGAGARDLDAIVLKALHKEPQRRYASAAQLGDDLERWLEGKPVLARPDSTAYRLRTFARRHPVGLSILLLGLLMLAAFAATMAWQADRLAHQRDRAEHEARVANEATDFLLELFAASDPRERNPEDLRARDLLDAAADRLPHVLASDPLTRARMMRVIGLAFNNLGDRERSIDLLRQSLTLRERFAGADSAEAADSLNRLGDILRQAGRLEEAEPMLRRALEWRSANGPVNYDLADSHNNLGLLQSELGKLAEAEPTLRRSIALHEQSDGPNARGMSAPLHNLALLLRQLGRLQEAHAVARRSLQIKRDAGMQNAMIAHTQAVVARVELELGLLEDAFANASESLELMRSVHGAGSPMVTSTMATTARVLLGRGEVEAARAMHLEALRIHRAAGEQDSLTAASSLRSYGHFLLAIGDSAQARAHFQQALDTARPHLPQGGSALQGFEELLDLAPPP